VPFVYGSTVGGAGGWVRRSGAFVGMRREALARLRLGPSVWQKAPGRDRG